ncbi:MAG: aspartyl-tRNA(Asn)/glutamyl-tRNA(Gln) amidotransferase subunit [Thermoproteota archaeon]|nr:aspartyl-tRNA(Asn)/glutamyl-tRNA(Gln) amidotransferase subunit [Thermoproteota archaeon]
MKKMVSISEKEVEHIAWLAKITLSEEEKKLFTEQFNTILEYFRIIDELETEGTPPTFNVQNLENVFREDIVEPSLSREYSLKNASKKEKGYVKASRII